jgi:hypothetical protein
MLDRIVIFEIRIRFVTKLPAGKYGESYHSFQIVLYSCIQYEGPEMNTRLQKSYVLFHVLVELQLSQTEGVCVWT